MKKRAYWVLAVAAVAAACGGNVVVDGSAVGGAPPTTTAGSTGGVTTTSSTTTVGTTSTTSSTSSTGIPGGSGSSGVPCVTSCPDGLATGILPCDGLPFITYTALVACACGNVGLCATPCEEDLCKFHTVSAACMACLPGGCPNELMECNAH
jgi:hypothetical protein